MHRVCRKFKRPSRADEGNLLLLWIVSGFGLFIFAMTFLGIAWFMPWVFVFHTGLLVYFPYEPNGTDRYVRITGPLSKPFHNEWVGSQSIPKNCKNALVSAEDTRFFEHPGIDIESLEKNYDANKKRKRDRGGSTITQQLVKNAFLSRKRSYIRKAREIAGAVALDFIVSKDTQLTWYFNIVEFGPRLYGISAAAQKYFKKQPKDLSLKECVSLVAILPSPNKWNASLVKKTTTSFMAKRTRVIESRMRALGFLGRVKTEAPPKLEDLEEFMPMPIDPLDNSSLPHSSSGNSGLSTPLPDDPDSLDSPVPVPTIPSELENEGLPEQIEDGGFGILQPE